MDTRPTLLVDTTGDFGVLRRDDRLYVDKTQAIARLAGPKGDRSVFFARPRRFGKSLLVSTLAALFQGRQELFAGDSGGSAETWIHREGAWDWNSENCCPVIRLNVNITDVHEVDLLVEELHNLVRRLCRVHEVPALPEDTRLSPARGLQYLIEDVHTRTGREVVVLIDEYDAPITSNLNRPVIEDVLDLMRSFYGVLKSCSGIMRLLFVTGITRFARTGLFSGANHLMDLSSDPVFHNLVGITPEELAGCLQPWVVQAAQALELPVPEVCEALAAFYNGYRFGPAQSPVYNPYSLLLCLRDMGNVERAQEIKGRGLYHGLPNYWAESGSPGFLVRLLESGVYDLAQLPGDVGKLERVSYDASRPDYAALMHQSGFLTRKGNQKTGWYLDFPNREVQVTFAETIVLGRQKKLPKLDHTLRRSVQQAVLDADADALAGTFSACLSGLGYPLQPPVGVNADRAEPTTIRRGWTQRWDYETHYQALLCNTLRMAGLPPWAEVATARGRIDVVVDLPDRVFVFEIKLNDSAEAALRQACTGDYPGLFAATNKSVTVVGFNIDTQARNVEACWVQDLGRHRMRAARWEREPFAQTLHELGLIPVEERPSLVFTGTGLTQSGRASGMSEKAEAG